MNQGDNPIIGYHAYDKHYNIIAPDRVLNPIFYSKKRSLQAAEAYGRSQDVLDVTALHLNGILRVIFHDTGDFILDGRSAQRFVKGCKRQSIPVNEERQKSIQLTESKPVYSCRQLLEV